MNDPNKAKTGWIVLGVGGGVAVGGIVLDIVGAVSGSVAGAGGSDNGQTNNTKTDFYFLGTTMIVAGVVAGVYGGAMVWDATHGADMQATPPRRTDAALDGVTAVAQAKLASAPAVMIPVASATF